jgi:DNA segregation ATPase FtsK/SpoIIIE-like protein
MNLKQFCYQSSYGVMRGLAQELGIKPHKHYRPSGNNAARVNTLKLAGVNPHYLSKITGMQNELTMFAGLDDKHKVRIGWQSSNILIEIPKPPPLWKQVTIEAMQQCRLIKRGPIATIGLGLQDEPKRIDFDEASMAHVFITGQTRSGKTNTQRLVAWNLACNTIPDEAQMIIFDVAKKGFNWDDFGNVANLAHPIITEIDKADRVLTWLSQEIDRRGSEKRVTPKVFVLVDELKALVDDSKVASDYLARIASVGGEFGLHLILSTQYPQIGMLGSAELKRNVTTRLCGKVDDAGSAANALGIAGSGAETLQGYGDFLLRDFDGLSRLTVAKIEESHIAKLERVDSVAKLDLPHLDGVNGGPPATRPPEPLEPEQVAVALFEPMSINKLQKCLGIGGSRATRVKRFADGIRNWAKDNGNKSQTYNFLDSNWTEV